MSYCTEMIHAVHPANSDDFSIWARVLFSACLIACACPSGWRQ